MKQQKVHTLLALFLIFSSIGLGQDTLSMTTFFPSGTHFLSLRANIAEAKVGVLILADNRTLKVDIGNSLDLIKLDYKDASSISIGLDFMAYANAVSYREYQLQISALDGFFGGNLVYSKGAKDFRKFLRLRYLHNSAHQVDGYFDATNNQWLNNRMPVPFIRDNMEIGGAIESTGNEFHMRPYAAVSYSVHTRPRDFKKILAYTGIEVNTINHDEKAKLPLCYFMAAQTQLSGSTAYQMSYHIQGGLKFGKWESKGILFYLSYYNGRNYFNEFYEYRLNRFSFGFFADFP